MLDEPTTGLHFEDIKKLLVVLRRLVEAGNSVIVIEHNLDVIKCADYIVDLGPEGGGGGGAGDRRGNSRGGGASCRGRTRGNFSLRLLRGTTRVMPQAPKKRRENRGWGGERMTSPSAIVSFTARAMDIALTEPFAVATGAQAAACQRTRRDRAGRWHRRDGRGGPLYIDQRRNAGGVASLRWSRSWLVARSRRAPNSPACGPKWRVV